VSVLAGLWVFSGLASAQWARIGGGNGNAGSAPGNGPSHAGTCILLTDGSVMCHEVADPLPQGSVDGTHWWRLTPDSNGKYETGEWSKLTDSPSGYGPLFYCSAVLADGRVVFIGGEYNLIANNSSPDAETTLGYVFDPTQNGGNGQWSSTISLGSTGWTSIGDSSCSILPDKTFILADVYSKQMATLDLGTLTLSLVNSPNLENSKADNNSEEGWTLLPNGTILTVDTANNTGTGSEIYSPVSQTWAATGNTPFTLVSNTGNVHIVPEMGPQVLRPDGTVVAFGANPNYTAVYHTSGPLAGTWTAGPTSSGDDADAPASLLPSGNVLVGFEASFFSKPTNYYEFDGTNLNPVTNPPNASNDPTFVTTMLLLPTGQVLFTDLSGDVELYTSTFAPPDTYNPAWQPTISSSPTYLGLGTTYALSGTQLNGLSQASAYGDDATMATNYPLVTITNNGTGHVFYARTHDHSSMGVATGSATVSTNFDVPSGMETGASTLVVIADGIPSLPYSVNVAPGTVLTYTGATSGDFNDSVTLSARLTSGGSPISGVTVDFTNTFGGGPCSGITDGGGNASCSVTPTVAAGSSYKVNATFPGNSSYGQSSTSASFTVLLEESKLTITGPLTSDYNDAVTVVAKLIDPDGGAAITGKSVKFVLGAGTGTETCSGSTDAMGNASCSITPNQAAASYTLKATFTDGVYYESAATSDSFIVTLEDSSLAITTPGPLTSDYHDAISVQAQLTDPDDSTAISGKTVTFALGSGTGTETCSASTNALGNASCSITPNQAAGAYTLAATFTDGVFYKSASNSAPFTITKEETAISFTATSATMTTYGGPATFSANLLEDGTTAPVPSGQTVTFTLGSGMKAQVCSGTVSATGLVSCTIPAVYQTGPMYVVASFAGDPYYLPATASDAVNPAATFLAAACGGASVPYGPTYGCTISVGSSIGGAVGVITYTYDANPAVNLTLVNGEAQISLATPAVGSHTLVIGYAKQGLFQAAASVTRTFTVDPAITSVQLTPSSYGPAAGSALTLSVSVTSYSVSPPTGGLVTFFDKGVSIGSGTVNALGQFSLLIPSVAAGTHSYTAQFGGLPPDYAAGTSNVLSITAH
jgi:hypothetical protein